MNNIIHRHQTQGASANARKVIGVEKASYANKTESLPPEEATTETKESIPTPPILTREQKKQEFSALEKARRLEAEAKNKLSKAEQLAKAYDSNDLEQIAKAHHMSVTDYVRWVNAKAVGAPTEKPLNPAEQAELQAQEWKKTQELEIADLKRFKSNLNKDWYINKNILPHLIKNPEKYELICEKGVDEQASIIYDFMNEHFNNTGGPGRGEELDPVAALDHLEELYLEEWKQLEERKSRLKKLNATSTPATNSNSTSPTGAKRIAKAAPSEEVPASPDDMLAQTLASEDSLANAAPSNMVAGPSRGSSDAETQPKPKPSWQTGGVTPKNSKFSREARLAEMAKGR